MTAEEHQKIIAREHNPELRAFYELLWHLGESQSDVARLSTEGVNWTERTVSVQRGKTKVPVGIAFGTNAAAVMETLPNGVGYFRGCLGRRHSTAKHFIERLATVNSKGFSLHCCRYSWAERAKVVGMPKRRAQRRVGTSFRFPP